MKSVSPTAARRLVLQTRVARDFGLLMGAMRVRVEKYWDANS